MDDSLLWECNQTELLQLAYEQGLGRLRAGLPKEVLFQIVRGEVNPGPEHLSDTKETRELLEKFIERHWEKTRSQLPGCTGKCTSYPCSEGRHGACYAPNKHLVSLG
jgi:hypothetical protein